MKIESKDKILKVRLSQTQLDELRYKAHTLGFRGISDYIRFQLLLSQSHVDKIEKIYQKVCMNNG